MQGVRQGWRIVSTATVLQQIANQVRMHHFVLIEQSHQGTQVGTALVHSGFNPIRYKQRHQGRSQRALLQSASLSDPAWAWLNERSCCIRSLSSLLATSCKKKADTYPRQSRTAVPYLQKEPYLHPHNNMQASNNGRVDLQQVAEHAVGADTRFDGKRSQHLRHLIPAVAKEKRFKLLHNLRQIVLVDPTHHQLPLKIEPFMQHLLRRPLASLATGS